MCLGVRRTQGKKIHDPNVGGKSGVTFGSCLSYKKIFGGRFCVIRIRLRPTD